MRPSDIPENAPLRRLLDHEVPKELARLTIGCANLTGDVADGVLETVGKDPLITDAFLENTDGSYRVNPDSRILSGHFPGMPIVPGVLAKRLIQALSSADLYCHHDADGNHFVWETEFLSAIPSNADSIRLKREGDEYVLENGSKPLVRCSKKTARLKESESDGGINLQSHHLKDILHDSIERIERDDADKFVLQNDPFRFVSTGGKLFDEQELSDPNVLGGYFEIPSGFSFADSETEYVPLEIIEESVAQIASFAYAKTRGLPNVRTEDDQLNSKAKVLTFKTSVSEAGSRSLFSGDRLYVVIDVLTETDREVSFAYEAWNSMR